MNAPTASVHTHMGTPPSDYHQEWVTHTVHVHGFVVTVSTREFTTSRVTTCFFSPSDFLATSQRLLSSTALKKTVYLGLIKSENSLVGPE
jgi:phage terminase large subunit-like protein